MFSVRTCIPRIGLFLFVLCSIQQVAATDAASLNAARTRYLITEKADTGGGILPLHNFSLSVVLKDQTIYIKWLAENEMNTEKFILQRSTDGNSFKDLEAFDPQGPMNVLTEYNALDNTLDFQSPVVYYRVKAQDNRLNFAYSNVVPVRVSKQSGFSFWPIPFQTSLQLTYNAPSATSIRVDMYDLSGRLQVQQRFNLTRGMNQLSLNNVSHLVHGIYSVRITDQMTHETAFATVAK